MTALAIGDLAQSLLLSRQSASLKEALSTLSTEVTTGLAADKTLRLAGDHAPLAGIESSLTRLDAHGAVASETAIMASVMQISLQSLSGQADDLGTALLAAATSQAPVRIDTLGLDAGQRLQSVLAALNARFGDRSVFAGQQTGSAAVADAETLLSALDAAVAGALSSADVETAVDAWFSDPLGFAATAYLGGDPLGPVPVSPDDSIALDITALDPAIVATLKGLAMAALLGRGALAGSDAGRADLARRAGESLAGSGTARAELSARLGTREAAIADAATRNGAEKSALETARLDLLSVDPYETAARLQQTQNQLEALYTLTARLSRLTLAEYL